VRALASLEDALPLLSVSDQLTLGLPLSAVVAQRLRLPTVDPQEFAEMVRIQIEKAVPYSLDEITIDFEIIEQAEADSVVSAVAVHNGKLNEIATPLLNRGFIPSQVTVYAAQRAATHAAAGHALLIYREDETIVCVISENGKLSLTRMIEGLDAAQLQMDLPQLALSAELQGIGSSFPTVLLDESCLQLRETVEYLFSSRPELINVETPPAAVKLNLLPESWRQRRSQVVRQSQWRRRLLWAGGVYAGLVVLLALYLFGLRLALGRLDRRIATDAPKVEFVRQTEAKWNALAPAIDPRYYPIEVLLQLFDSLPSPDVRITAYNQSARQVSVDGEAKTTALAFQFAEKVKKNAELRTFQFEMAAPRILPNDHAQFRLEGKPR
jgi:hypothetical protein